MTDSGGEAIRSGQETLPIEELLAGIAQQMHAERGQQMVHVEPLAARPAQYASPSAPLPDALQRALDLLGIEQLYTHQAEAIERVRKGENIVVVTATSSGKTLCYNLPIIEEILRERTARALYLYPINALINDQFKTLFKINLALGKEAIGIARYTGALSEDQRKAARARNPHLWLTNPEMLHLSFLLWHPNWEELWRNLRFIVVDEVHTYRGVFGSNMAQLFRRVLRMARHYGANPQFICCSATIANPKELAETLTGLPFSVIDRDGAGSGRKHFVLWNPPLQSDDGSNVRRSYAQESVDLLLDCVRANYNTIVFSRARRLTERMLRMSRELAEQQGESDLLERISSYRAGYLADERETIESKLKTGDIKGIITTNALEMGIDIGGLDAAIISGYPGTIMSTWQQAGRAGRRGREALIFLVASQNPLDQYYMNHPREFFAQPHELAVVDLDNQYIRLKHLLCAARELPFLPLELAQMEPDARMFIDELRQADLLTTIEDGSEGLTYPASRRDIHFRVSLRAASHESYRILDSAQNEIGSIEPPNVFREAHPGAIYQHGDEDYRVTYLDRQRKIVRVEMEQAPHYTRSSSTQSVKVEQVHASQTLDLGGLPFAISLGDVIVEETIFSYQELRLGTDELVKRVNLSYPLMMRLHTTAMWVTVPPVLGDLVASAALPTEGETGEGASASPFEDGLHAMQHLLTGVMPLLVMCDRRDVDGFFELNHPDLGAPVVFVYDNYEGGIGLAEVAYQRVGQLLRLAHDTVAHCECKAGCPSCIQSGACRQRNEGLSKPAADLILFQLVGPVRHDANDVGDVIDLSPLASRSQLATMAERLKLGGGHALQDLLEQTRRKGLETNAPATPPTPITPQFAKGDRVDLSPYGQGTVIASRIEHNHEIVTARFSRRGVVKEIDTSKSSLRKLS